MQIEFVIEKLRVLGDEYSMTGMTTKNPISKYEQVVRIWTSKSSDPDEVDFNRNNVPLVGEVEDFDRGYIVDGEDGEEEEVDDADGDQDMVPVAPVAPVAMVDYKVNQVVSVNFPPHGGYPCHITAVNNDANKTVNVKGFDKDSRKIAWIVLKLDRAHLHDPIEDTPTLYALEPELNVHDDAELAEASADGDYECERVTSGSSRYDMEEGEYDDLEEPPATVQDVLKEGDEVEETPPVSNSRMLCKKKKIIYCFGADDNGWDRGKVLRLKTTGMMDENHVIVDYWVQIDSDLFTCDLSKENYYQKVDDGPAMVAGNWAFLK